MVSAHALTLGFEAHIDPLLLASFALNYLIDIFRWICLCLEESLHLCNRNILLSGKTTIKSEALSTT